MLSAVNLASYSKSLLSYEQEGKGYEESWRSQASGMSSCSSTTSQAGFLGPNTPPPPPPPLPSPTKWAMLRVSWPTKN